jgi:hypothetical protein
MPDPQPQQPPQPDAKKSTKLELSPSTLELSKSLIGCSGGILTALVTGVFLLLTNSGILQRTFNPPTATAVVTLTSIPAQTSPAPALTPMENANTTLTSTGVTDTAAPPALTVTPPVTAPRAGPLTFAAGFYGLNVIPVEAGARFPAGITKIFAIFPVENLRDGDAWRTEWYQGGKLVDQAAGLWHGAANSTTYAWEGQPQGFNAGDWEFRVYLNDVLAQSAPFSIVAQTAGTPYFGPVQYAQGFKDGAPVSPYGDGWFVFQSGISAVTAYFHAGDMVKGTQWEARWYLNGDLIEGATQTYIWTGDGDAASYYSAQLSQPQGLAQGTYTLKLSVQGIVLQLSTFMVSPAQNATSTPEPAPAQTDTTAQNVPSYGPFTFAAGEIDTSQPVEPGASFPQSITQIVAVYQYQLPRNSTWKDQWYLNGNLFVEHSGVWTAKPDGYSNSWLWDADGLPPGSWELRSYANDKLIQSGSFNIEAQTPGQPTFGAVTFAEGIKDGQPVNPHQPRVDFAGGSNQIVAFFPGLNLTPATEWTAEWLGNGVSLSTVTYKGHASSESDQPYTARLNSLQSLPAGTYMLKLSINGKVVQMATCMVTE